MRDAMNESPPSPPFHEAEGLPSASPNPPPTRRQLDRPLAPPVSSQSSSLQKTNSGERDGVLTKNVGFPLRLLLRELEPERKLDSTKRESSLPASPLRSPENTIRSENSVKSSERDGPIIDARLNSLLEHAGSPAGYTEGFSPEENHVAAMGAEAVGSRRGKVLRMESGVVRRAALRKVEVGIRVSEVVLCIVSFSVMAANKTSGWAGDYFERYQEYRYCFSVNVIASVYSTFQLYSQFHYRIRKSHIISHPLSYSFEFVMDQVLAYLLMSASSSAASCNDDWVSMFGSDKFTSLTVISITMSFFAFSAFSISSIISAYKLFSQNP